MTKNFKKYFRVNRLFFILGVILIVNFFVLETVFFFLAKYDYENPESLLSVQQNDKYCYVDIIRVYPPFTIYRKAGNYMGWLYFVYDENFMYIANLSPLDRKKLASNIKETLNHTDIYDMATFRVYGMSVEIDAFLQYRTINIFSDTMTFENVEDYIGAFYINTRSNPNKVFIERTKYASFSLIIGLLLLIIYIYRYKKRRKFLKLNNDELLNMEKEMDSIRCDKKHKIIYTENYTFSYHKNPILVNNSNVIWVYPLEFLYSRKKREVSIHVVLNDGKVIILTSYIYHKKNKEKSDTYNNSFKDIYQKALYGYTAENFKKVKNSKLKGCLIFK